MKTPSDLLDADIIRAHLNKQGFSHPYELHCFSEIDSTNQFLKNHPSTSCTQYCTAETQTQGRGRFERKWHSPFGKNIYFSGRWRWENHLSALSGLSLVIGLALVNTLQTTLNTHNLLIKWPNDLIWNDRKLGGILIELDTRPQGSTDVIIGIGLNVNSSQQSNAPIDKPWCSLFDITGTMIDRNTLISKLIVTLNDYIHRFSDNGFDAFQSEWNLVDYLKNQWITVNYLGNTQQGEARGVTAQGLLNLKTANGEMIVLSAGETSILRE